MKKKIVLGLCLLNLSQQAFSYPLVAESESIRMGDILTLYPDHRDPNKVYFFPNSSMIAKDSANMPMFSLTTWGLNDVPFNPEVAGAWMTFTSRLNSDPLQQKALNSYLADNPSKRIAVIPVKESTLGLTSTEQNATSFSKLFDEMSFSRLGGHAEDEIGFMATLTGIGARVFKQAILKPDAFKINYCYRFDGAGPDMDAKVVVNWKRVYDHYRATFSSGRWFAKVSITKEVETLRQQGHVHWEINGGSADDQHYVQQIAEKIVERLFKPELQYVPAHAASFNKGWSFARFGFSQTHREELKEETWTMVRRELVERERCLPVNVKDVNKFYNDLVTDA
jgi:hypothetical protein